MPVDHFGSTSSSSGATFQQRVCLFTSFHDAAGSNGTAAAPMFFYTGNESPVEEYVNNTGLMWELGAKLGAVLVWAEHRYEPKTHPSLVGSQNCFAFGTTAQALQDYVTLVGTIRQELALPAATPVIAFGGSYGGMLAGWARIKYPHVFAGAIAASAPVWGLATTMTDERLDWSARAIARGISKAGGATDRCLANVRASWPLLQEIGRSKVALRLLGEAAHACAPGEVGSVGDILSWVKQPWFDLAEGNFPFASTYITYSVGPGYFPLPAWPLRVACERGLNDDLGVLTDGDVADVRYNVSVGSGSYRLSVHVDWDTATPIGWDASELTEATVRASGALDLMSALAGAVGVWYNVTGDKSCYRLDYAADSPAERRSPLLRAAAGIRQHSPGVTAAATTVESPTECASCPPCGSVGGCPPCPVASCVPGTCQYKGAVSKTFSWNLVTCNEDLTLYNLDVHGIGHDLWWPPSVTPRHQPTVPEVVGPRHMEGGCGPLYAKRGLPGGPLHKDPWSGWLTAYYHGPNLTTVRNIVWSNGLLDPWSGGGVYPPRGGIDGPPLQNISSDGSQVALLIDLGAHHLDLFFADEADPPSARYARKIEAAMIEQWAEEWRAAH